MTRASLTAAFVCAMGAAVSAEAQVSRVFVSVDGNDANVCSNIATPCRTIGGGVAQVDAEGEVIIVSSGSYAGGTISKPVKVNAAAGVVAFSGLPITVDPGTGKLVVIRGMTIKAATPGSGDGITLASGRLSLENSVLDGWFRGILVNSPAEQLHVSDSALRNMAQQGILASGSGHTSVTNTRFAGNGIAYYPAYEGHNSTTASFSRCEISGGISGGAGGGIWLYNFSSAFVDDCRITNVSYGLYNTGTMRVSRTVVTKNSEIGVWNNGGTLESFGNNVFRGNVVNTDGTITSVAMQ